MQEAADATAALGGTYHYAGGYDLEVEYNDIYRKRTVRILREVDPLIVFAPPPMDYLVDHEETSKLVRNAAYIASVKNYDCGVPTKPTERFPYLYYSNAFGLADIFGRALPLSCAVDISSVIERKTELLCYHASQREWLAHLNQMDDYTKNMREQSAREGTCIGVGFAEGFIQHLGSGHPQDNILKQLLGDRCVEYGH